MRWLSVSSFTVGAEYTSVRADRNVKDWGRVNVGAVPEVFADVCSCELHPNFGGANSLLNIVVAF
jgi:hypothetical protein